MQKAGQTINMSVGAYHAKKASLLIGLPLARMGITASGYFCVSHSGIWQALPYSVLSETLPYKPA